jgi:hypothetical protein
VNAPVRSEPSFDFTDQLSPEGSGGDCPKADCRPGYSRSALIGSGDIRPGRELSRLGSSRLCAFQSGRPRRHESAILALLILLVGPRAVQKSAERKQGIVPSLPAGPNPIDQGLNRLMRRVGPLTFLSIAFVGGLLAGRGS